MTIVTNLGQKRENTVPGECSSLKITETESKEHSDDVEDITSSTRQQTR